MIPRPRSIAIICWLFIVVGTLALLGSVLKQISPQTSQTIAQFRTHHPILFLWGHLSPILLILCGALIWFRYGWARWLLILWLGNTLALDVYDGFHVFTGLLQHTLFFAVTAFYLFRPSAVDYMRRTGTPLPEIVRDDETPVA